MKQKALKTTIGSKPEIFFFINDTKNLAQEGSRWVCLIRAGNRFLWLPWDRAYFQVQLTITMLSATSGRAQTALLTLPWKRPGVPFQGLEHQLGCSGLQGTEEPTKSDWNKIGIYHFQSKQSRSGGSSTIEVRAPEYHWGPRFLSSFCSTYSDFGFCPQSFTPVITKWLPLSQYIYYIFAQSLQNAEER